MKKKLLYGVCLCTFVCLLSGCQTDRYYQNRAADRAREYLLDHAPELSPYQRWYVRLYDPILLHGEGLEAFGRSRARKQICIAWQIPGEERLYLVYGVSSERMQFWRPIRLLRKTYVPPPRNRGAILAAARAQVQTNLYKRLSVVDFNRVRFQYPTVYETNFELNFDPKGTTPPEELAALRKMAANMKQLSLVWPCSDGKNAVVLAGLSPNVAPNGEKMTEWNMNFCSVLSVDELKKHTLHLEFAASDFEKPPVKEKRK